MPLCHRRDVNGPGRDVIVGKSGTLFDGAPINLFRNLRSQAPRSTSSGICGNGCGQLEALGAANEEDRNVGR